MLCPEQRMTIGKTYLIVPLIKVILIAYVKLGQISQIVYVNHANIIQIVLKRHVRI